MGNRNGSSAAPPPVDPRPHQPDEGGLERRRKRRQTLLTSTGRDGTVLTSQGSAGSDGAGGKTLLGQ